MTLKKETTVGHPRHWHRGFFNVPKVYLHKLFLIKREGHGANTVSFTLGSLDGAYTPNYTRNNRSPKVDKHKGQGRSHVGFHWKAKTFGNKYMLQ